MMMSEWRLHRGNRLTLHIIAAMMIAAGWTGAMPAQRISPASSNTAALDALAAAEMASSGAPSIQIALAYEGRPVVERAYGQADLENRTPATPQTEYRTASVAKWMTATAAMMLVEAGKLDLDAPLQTYCPQFPAKAAPVTTRELLAHTSGIRHDPDYDAQFAAATSDTQRLEIERRRSREAIGRFTRYGDIASTLGNFKDDPLLFTPGTRWLYSSPDYRVLACVLEGASGRPYRDLMKASIFEPAHMERTVPDDAWAIVPNRAGLYQILNQRLELRRADYRDVSENLAAGGYLSTAGDLVAFARNFYGGKYVGRSSIALMAKPVANAEMLWERPSGTTPLEVPDGQRYGYGLMLFPSEDGTWTGHTGRQDGASSILVVSPDRKCTAAVMLNVRSWAKGFDFARKVCRVASQTP